MQIATLARLDIPEQAATHYHDELSRIVDFVDQLSTVDTGDVAPLSHPLEATQRLRPDTITETNQRDKFQAIAPQIQEGLYLVPQVIEE